MTAAHTGGWYGPCYYTAGENFQRRQVMDSRKIGLLWLKFHTNPFNYSYLDFDYYFGYAQFEFWGQFLLL